MKLAEARQRMQVLESELRQIDDQMDELVQEFKDTYRRPWVAHPAIHRSGGKVGPCSGGVYVDSTASASPG